MKPSWVRLLLRYRAPLVLSSLMAGLVVVSLTVWAADHRDAPATTADPAADINDVYAWMNADATKLNLVMSVFPSATADSQFSDAVQYVFHVNRGAAFGNTPGETNIIIEFDAAGAMNLWVGDDYLLSGDASSAAGLSSDDGAVKVFAGVRNDPFFFDLKAFQDTADVVTAAAPGLDYDAAGCPDLDAATSETLLNLLTDVDGENNGDFFKGGGELTGNILAIVVQLDKAVLEGEGDVVAVWGSTHAKPAPVEVE